MAAAAAGVANQLVKVDLTALPFVEASYLVFINFTLSVQECEDRAILALCAQLIEEYLQRHVLTAGVSVGFQITASFKLTHSDTGETKLFTGSFFNTSSVMNSLSGNQFFPYRPESFRRHILNYANPQQAAQKLLQLAADLDTHWQFEQLVSIIINAQSVLPQGHPFVRLHRLDNIVNRHGRRRTRAHVTTYLP